MKNVAADPSIPQSSLDTTIICLDRMHALAELLALEEVAAAFTSLSLSAQVALFGTLESGIKEARDAITRTIVC